jgi:hypothetical protein
VQLIAFSALVGATGAVFGATTEWFQRTLSWAGSSVASVFTGVSLPSIPSDLSTVPTTFWIILLVVGFGLAAGAAVFSWAMKEE